MSDAAGDPLGEVRRATLAGLADALIPGDGSMPSASAADVPARWIDRALRVRDDLADGLAAILDAAAGADPRRELERLERERPDALETLELLVAGAYFMSPRVRKRIGYPGQTQRPIYPEEAEHYLDGDLLAPVIRRGALFVPTPEGHGGRDGDGGRAGAPPR